MDSQPFILISTSIADGCPHDSTPEDYTKMLQKCIHSLTAERAHICQYWLNEVKQLKQQIVDMDGSYSEKLGRATQELQQLKAEPKPMELDGYLALRAVADHMRDQAMSDLMAKIQEMKTENANLANKVLQMQEEVDEFHHTINHAGMDFEIAHVAEVINDILRDVESPYLLDSQVLMQEHHDLGGWLTLMIREAIINGTRVVLGHLHLPLIENEDRVESDSDQSDSDL